jgi:hypothetical protein
MTTVGPKTTTSSTITPKAVQSSLTISLVSTSVNTGSSATLSTTGGSGSGAVVYQAGPNCSVVGNILTVGDAGGSCVVQATKLGDSTYRSIDANDVTITIVKINQATTPTLTNANSVVYGQTLTLSGAGGSGTGAFTYSVVDAGTTGCSVNSSTGLLTVSAVGTCQVGVQRAASTNYNASSVGTQNITVSAAPQTITFTSTLPTLPIAGDDYTVTATASSGLTVSFSITSGSCTVSSGVVSFVGSGSCVIKASSGSTSQYLAAPDVYQTVAVGQRNQLLNFTSATIAITEKTYGDTSFFVAASSSEPDATITYSVGSATTNSACSVSTGGLVQVLEVGFCVIEAASGSGEAYAAASGISQTIEIVSDYAAAPFVTSTSAGNQSLTVSYFAPNYTGGTDITGYQVIAVPQSGSSPTLVESGCGIVTSNGALTCTIRGLLNGVAYRAQVAAINPAGVGAYSDPGAEVTAATNPSAVQRLHVVEANSSLEIGWSDPDSLGGGVFVEYRIFIKPSTTNDYGSSYFTISSYSTHSYTAVNLPDSTSLVNGVGYDIKILTVTSANSLELTANTAVVNQIPRTVPDAPRLATAIVMGGSVVVTWETPLSDGGAPISTYHAEFAGADCTATSGVESSCTFPLPSGSGSYPYQVDAANVAGRGDAATGVLQIAGASGGFSFGSGPVTIEIKKTGTTKRNDKDKKGSSSSNSSGSSKPVTNSSGSSSQSSGVTGSNSSVGQSGSSSTESESAESSGTKRPIAKPGEETIAKPSTGSRPDSNEDIWMLGIFLALAISGFFSVVAKRRKPRARH